MKKLKEKELYYFTVEGETEKLYFDHLEKLINDSPDSLYAVKFIVQKETNPSHYVKTLNHLGKLEITHIFDMESNNDIHKKQFKETLDKMRTAEKLGKSIKYNLGYSNFTFELWMILHKNDCNSPKSDRKQYLKDLKKAYNIDFEDLRAYKKEANFKRLLHTIELSDVRAAVDRAKYIMELKKENSIPLKKYGAYYYYEDNPSLSIWIIIEKILKKCNLLEQPF